MNFANRLFTEDFADPRCAALSKRRHSQIKCWPGDDSFVVEGDAYDIITKMGRQYDMPETLDYFFSSFMVHHVPNGDGLRTLIFGNDDLLNRADLLRPSDNASFFLAKVKEYLVSSANPPAASFRRLMEDKNKFAEYIAFGLAEYIRGGLSEENLSGLDSLLKEIKKCLDIKHVGGSIPEFGPDELEIYFCDFQAQMFLAIKSMLREGGLLIIADPDGQSRFNREKVLLNNGLGVELTIAHFRNKTRMCNTLRRAGFDIVLDETIASYSLSYGTGGTDYVLMNDQELMRYSASMEDDNLGYIIAARKPRSTFCKKTS